LLDKGEALPCLLEGKKGRGKKKFSATIGGGRSQTAQKKEEWLNATAEEKKGKKKKSLPPISSESVVAHRTGAAERGGERPRSGRPGERKGNPLLAKKKVVNRRLHEKKREG